MCKVSGCDRPSKYKKQDVCQKHYFRFMRFGTYELTKFGKRKGKLITPNGYTSIHKPDHPLSDHNGYVFEHRYVLFKNIGYGDHSCEICGKPWNWNSHYDHVDHIDSNKANNRIENLRPLCNSCNTKRGKRPRHESSNCKGIEWLGETKTANEWGRDKRIPCKGYVIRNRLNSGWTLEDTMTKPSRKK